MAKASASIKWINKKKIISFLTGVNKDFIAAVNTKMLDIMINEVEYDAKMNATTGPLKRRTGTLARGIKGFSEIKNKTKVSAGLKVDLRRVPYARIHELGGIIKPKKSKYLTIPFPGVKGKVRQYKNTFVAKGVIFQKLGKKLKALFVLKKQVTIPARPYLEPALRMNLKKIRAILKAMNESDF